MSMMIPYNLENDYLNNKCILFVGAGLSLRVKRKDGTRLPGWNDFVKQLVDFAHSRDAISLNEKNALYEMLKDNKHIAVAQIVVDELKESEFQSFLSDMFHDIKPNDIAYQKICQMPFRAIITTNFDSLIEDAYQMFGSEKIKVWTQYDVKSNLAQTEKTFLLKLHGSYDRQSTIVLGSQGFLKSMHENALLVELMESLLINNTFLFIGYSMNDPDFNALLDHINTICANNNKTHYLAMESGRVSPIEQKYLKKHRNLCIVEYTNSCGQHEGLIDILEALKKKRSL